jgi:hypothetical protein
MEWVLSKLTEGILGAQTPDSDVEDDERDGVTGEDGWASVTRGQTLFTWIREHPHIQYARSVS